MQLDVLDSRDLDSAPIAALGIMGGYGVARATGIRPLGGAVLAVAGLAAAHVWNRERGGAVAAGLGALYLAAFGLSHPLAKRIGAWPSVIAVTAAVAGASYALVDRRR